MAFISTRYVSSSAPYFFSIFKKILSEEMANEGNNGVRIIDTSEPKQIATTPPQAAKFEGSSSSAAFNNPSSVFFARSSSLSLNQMNNSFNFSSIPCIFSSPRVSSPKLSRYLARHHSWDMSNTDLSLENEIVPFDEDLLEWARANETEQQSESESLGIDTSDILLLDSPNEIISKDPNPVPSSDVHCQNEGEVPNLHKDSRRRCLAFETTGSPAKHLSDIYPDFITTDESAEKPKSDSSNCLVSGIGLHLNSVVRVREDSNNAMVVANVVKEDGEQSPSQINPKKKRRRLGKTEESEGCKRCNCKKSKCLKLYCECFAAGVYCIDSCSCQGCFNKPINVDMVVETRKMIECRNPLAFAPKVVNVPEVVVWNDSNNTPVSARHKTGCNCKKSNCLKRYCECNQGGVGCSSNCRCEGCKNPLGRKDGSKEEETKMIEIETINVEEDNRDSELCPEPLMAARYETTELPYLAIRRPLEMSNLSVVIPESSEDKRVGKENMPPPPPPPAARSRLAETLRVDYSPGSGIKITSSSSSSCSSPKANNSKKRVCSPYNYNNGGSSPNSSKRRRKIVLQSIPSFPLLTPPKRG